MQAGQVAILCCIHIADAAGGCVISDSKFGTIKSFSLFPNGEHIRPQYFFFLHVRVKLANTILTLQELNDYELHWHLYFVPTYLTYARMDVKG